MWREPLARYTEKAVVLAAFIAEAFGAAVVDCAGVVFISTVCAEAFVGVVFVFPDGLSMVRLIVFAVAPSKVPLLFCGNAERVTRTVLPVAFLKETVVLDCAGRIGARSASLQ